MKFVVALMMVIGLAACSCKETRKDDSLGGAQPAAPSTQSVAGDAEPAGQLNLETEKKEYEARSKPDSVPTGMLSGSPSNNAAPK
ncbi:MAG: hypothetical protein GMKNLPBB_02593 [Myxococcota bacterium]|nr:hypothetical protein [Myxococcota bacterium]